MKKGIPFILIFCTLFAFAQKKEITLEDIFTKGTFRMESVSGFRSMNDGEHYAEWNNDKILQKVSFKDAKPVKEILDAKKLTYNNKSIEVADYAFNDDETKLLLLSEPENIYRHSALYKVYVYDISIQQLQLVSDNKIMHATFSPNSDKIAYVYENNIYIYSLDNNETIQVTHDGEYNIINGNCDWVYEEEFGFTQAFLWSAKGDYIVYYRFDQSNVKEYNFAIYDSLYPTDYRYKYPKAGEANAEVSIHIYNIKNKKTITCDLGTNKDIYIPRVYMNPFNNKTIIYKLNRLQNHLEIMEADTKSGNTTLILEEKNKYFVEINDHNYFLKNKNAFFFTSERDGYTHIYYHDIDNNKTQQITQGEWEVTNIEGYDEEKNTLYFVCTKNSPLERHFYAIKNEAPYDMNLLTPAAGYHVINCSKNFKYYLDRHSSITQVPTYTLYDMDGNKRVLKSNETIKKVMQEYQYRNMELIQVPNDEGVMLNAWIIKPVDFDDNKKYPLLMFQYSGPGSQQVSNQFGGRDMWWYQMLAQKGYIIVCADGTGTGYRGEAFKKKTYLQLGKYESDDQIAVAKYFAKKSYIDPARIGIWGWSYGGYMSSICILKGADVFKTAIAVAPVTNWRYYDNIYTERYMRTPQENAKGYDENSPVNMIAKLKGNYLIIHGSSDDNVHLQNTMMMINGLINANKDFDSEIYPNKNHSIYGGVTRLQLYRKITNYILEKL